MLKCILNLDEEHECDSMIPHQLTENYRRVKDKRRLFCLPGIGGVTSALNKVPKEVTAESPLVFYAGANNI